jgi:hypothetical protein
MKEQKRATRGTRRRTRRILTTDGNRRKDEAWKKEPPKDAEKCKKEVGMYTYLWWEHHMAWTVHKPANCLQGKQHKEEQKKKPHKANSSTFAAAAATAVNPQFAALMASITNLDE